MNISLITGGMKYVQGLATAGPWGLAAMGVGIVGLLGALAFMIARLNRATDQADLNSGGADAGVTAQTLKNQADLNREFEAQARKDFDNT